MEGKKKKRRKPTSPKGVHSVDFTGALVGGPFEPVMLDWNGTRWARDHSYCKRCLRNRYRHAAKGYCEPCYNRINELYRKLVKKERASSGRKESRKKRRMERERREAEEQRELEEELRRKEELEGKGGAG